MSRDPRLERWLEELVATPGLTAVADPAEARRVHIDDALAALELVREGPVVDVGSGGGSPGLPLAAALPELAFTLLEASSRRCAFLERAAAPFPNVRVVWARAEEHGRADGRDAYAVALARALAPPAVAAEWCLPLVRPGGLCILFAGAEAEGLAAAAQALAAAMVESRPVAGSRGKRLLVLAKLGPTPPRFPRRPGVARRRPLG
ncbi:MAG: class I SAM-dependent methyltransferase [Thermoleophilia bacterium]|nr:class I SAM-dependent methyltransferase [Thermoleophilia bacterium]